MRIAEALGGRTVTELAEELTVDEFGWWVEEFAERAREKSAAIEAARR